MPASVITVSEFPGMPAQIEGSQCIPMPPLVDQIVSVSGVSLQSNPFSANTRVIRIHTKAQCCIAVGTNPTATISNFSMAQYQTEYMRVNPGFIVAVIADP